MTDAQALADLDPDQRRVVQRFIDNTHARTDLTKAAKARVVTTYIDHLRGVATNPTIDGFRSPFVSVLSQPCGRHAAEPGQGCWTNTSEFRRPLRAVCGQRIRGRR